MMPVTLSWEGLVAGRARKQTCLFISEPGKQPVNGIGVSKYHTGDVLRVEFGSDAVQLRGPLLLRVERCDERHRIVFGTITSAPLGFGKALSDGAKLAVAYHLVCDNSTVSIRKRI